MVNEKLSNLIEKNKNIYKSINKILCPILDNKEIFFNMNGFDHLIRKGKDLRPISAQLSRLKLLKFVPDIIKNCKKISKHRRSTKVINNKKSEAHFWSLEDFCGGIKIIVIIRQVNDGNKHFFSVMEKKGKFKNTKDP